MTPRVRQYAEEIAFWHVVSASDVLGPSRKRIHAIARGDLMKRLRSEGFTTEQIGRWLSRDHSTVVYWTRELGGPERAPFERSKPTLASIPLEYRSTYLFLRRNRHLPASEARRMIDDQIAADAARFARTGQLQQSRRAA